MDQKPKLMTPFDMLVTSSSLYTLKLMLPFTPASMQRSLAIYIKFSELKSTMEHFYGFRNSDCQGSILDQLKSCLSPEEQTQMSQMEDLMNMMEMMRHADAADFMQDFMKGGFEDAERMDGPSDAEEYGSGEAGADPHRSQ